jgi:hypothetical protein
MNLRRPRKLASRYLRAPRRGGNASVWTLGEKPLARARQRYQGAFPVPAVSYGTVRDLADSRAHLGGLADANRDLKDVQRCWTVKAILGNVAPGSRLLEIGAGEPVVAGILSRLGYEVTIVDPYAGRGNGPRAFAAFRAAYPDLAFVRDSFPPAQPLAAGFGAVYSISVLEHLGPDEIRQALTAARGLLEPERGCAIHAIDVVIAGWGTEEHREKLEAAAAALGIEPAAVAAQVEQLRDDPETYFVSAETHESWRVGLPYDEYPMRRIASVNLFAPARG